MLPGAQALELESDIRAAPLICAHSDLIYCLVYMYVDIESLTQETGRGCCSRSGPGSVVRDFP